MVGSVHGRSDHCTRSGSESFTDFEGYDVIYQGIDFFRGVEPTNDYPNMYSTYAFRDEFKAMLARHLENNGEETVRLIET